MLNIDLSRCKYPNIVAEMLVMDMDFSEIGDVILASAKDTRAMLVTGRRKLYCEQAERVRSFFRIPDMNTLITPELVTSQDGTPFKAVVLGLKQEVFSLLDELAENKVKVTKVQQRSFDSVCDVIVKAEENAINYAEYRHFIDRVAEIKKLYKQLKGKLEMDTLEAYIKEHPEDASKKLVVMFNMMDDRSRLMLFATAFHDEQVKEARRKGRAK